MHRTESIPANSAATEHDEPFKKLIKDIFAKELTSEQKKKRKYKLPKATSITTEQRSFVNVILRKNLGDARVALYILEHSIPTLLEQPLGQNQWQADRRRRKMELQQQLRQGAHLAKLRDSNRKRFHEMSATEQRVLEDY